MTSRTRPWARWRLMGSTILSITTAGSAWASTMTRPSSRSTPSGPGMSGSGACAIGGSDRLLITADCGGSHGARVRLWKVELQKLADETGLTISVCHYPPGTSKWNKIEHRLFCPIPQTWRGRPLISYAAVVDLIAATTTTSGLTVDCVLDPRRYAKGIKVSDQEMACLN